jgi:hypothetical protein
MPILDLKVATVARDVAQLYATFRNFPRLCFATLRGFIKIIADDRKTSIHMASFFFVLRPSATFRNLLQLCATCVRNFGRNYVKVRSRIGQLRCKNRSKQLYVHGLLCYLCAYTLSPCDFNSMSSNCGARRGVKVIDPVASRQVGRAQVFCVLGPFVLQCTPP